MPGTLPSLDLKGLAHFIKSGQCKSIAFLTGAGVSVAAGIPDFRSPGGMYDTLQPHLLSADATEQGWMRQDPTAVVSWDLFRRNQLCYLELRRPFILGLAERKWKATLSHYFARLCHDKGLLTRLYTQNIDGLDFQTGVPESRIVSVHGTMGTISCEYCKAPVPTDEFQLWVRQSIKDIYKMDDSAPAESTPIPCPSCKKPGLKPDTVLYGRHLPARFFQLRETDFPDVDLLIVAGTSLTVSPANSVVQELPSPRPRLVVNREPVGQELGIEYGAQSTRDVFCGGDCDEVFLELCSELGWLEDLRKFQGEMAEQSATLLATRFPSGS